ncbi:choice-of-anchor B family protein [Paracrocinitomix mangrovi]|uniref:choice-of-anchor B family protein n=1 Tax=Paracrocinitomix mangrovi TaxID=2862509 RepID=UPI001C8D1571|nr:choice-of-anchor B family protein [Paracrocinitomix mangrovi]UKN02461.1 choice-of-anchor B family protein [Paracrocinitomix mangrovi]
MKILLLTVLVALSFTGMSQLNMSQLGQLDVPTTHATFCNDIWGYTDESNNEYALVGTEDGVSIVDVTDAANPAEIFWIDGMNSIWRDLKTVGDYVYVTTEAEEGLLIIDLEPLPSSTSLASTHYTGPVGNEWHTAHNLYAADGYVYVFGSGRGNGGVIILDVTTDPMNPIEVGTFDTWYAHDGYVLNDTGYFAHINDGFFSIVDLTDKANPALIETFATPSTFTHNIWTSANGDYAFTSDEVSGGYIGAYDVSNPANIKYLDKIQSSPGAGIVPHNVHVKGNYLYTSYYTDGVVVHDITHPNNLVEVGNYDTSPLSTPNTNGCWGVYPFLPSGNIIATDRQEGVFVLGDNVHAGAFVEGTITEFGLGNPINNVDVTIDNQNIYDNSNVLGDYATGIVNSGTYDITYSKVLYYPQTISTTLTEGNVLIQDVELVKIPQYNVTVTVLDAQTLNPVEGAQVVLNHTLVSHNGITDVNGEAVIDLYYQDNYEVIGGKWGYISDCFVDTLINNSVSNITLYVNEGIYDDFTFDYGWSVFGDAQKGMWEREVPVGVDVNGVVENPFKDGLFDCGSTAFITGNGSTAGNTDEVENGQTTLVSPVFDLTSYSDPHINFELFYYNFVGPFYPNDTLFVTLFNGTETVDIAKFHLDNTPLSLWYPYSIPVGGLIQMTSNMQLILTISDYVETVNICEAAFDHFRVTNFSMASEDEITDQNEIKIYPNPFKNVLNIYAKTGESVEILDVSGKIVLKTAFADQIDVSGLEKGVYILSIFDENNQKIDSKRIVKI